MHATLSKLHNALLGLGAAAASLVFAPAHAQINDAIRGVPSEANHFIATPRGWKQPMTPWGEPDIQATLDMMQASRLPLERCANSYSSRTLPTFLYGGRKGAPGKAACDTNKAWLTQAEYDKRMQAWRKQVDMSRQDLEEGNLGASLKAGAIDPNRPQRQTSLIVDPPNGLLPALTPEGKRRALAMHSSWALPGENAVYDSPQDFDSWDRCITRGMPSSMMPYRYNGGFRIVQAPGYVIFRLEMIHEARIIPTDGRPVPGSAIRQWMGISRGHWEGDTLVVVTDHYKVGPPMINLAVLGSPPGNRFPYSKQMKTTERIVRLNDDWWLYEITTSDPVVLTRPFTVRYPMRNDPTYFMPEYACHEDDTIVQDYVQTNRHERAHPTPIPEEPVKVSPALASALAGRWVGRPRIATLDLTMQLWFAKRPDGRIVGRLVGTNLGRIDKPLKSVRIKDRALSFELPNWQPWRFAGTLTGQGTIAGALISSQGGVPVTFRRKSR